MGHVKGQPMRYILGHKRFNRWPERTLAERFWPRVEKTDGCWLWKGATDPHGYGRIAVTEAGKKRSKLAHHVAWELTNGPIPEGALLMHQCDTPACVRPDPQHVRPGTQAENMRGCVQRGRHFSPFRPA